jgi:hypothetical protein
MQRKRWVGEDPGQYAKSLKKQLTDARKAVGI